MSSFLRRNANRNSWTKHTARGIIQKSCTTEPTFIFLTPLFTTVSLRNYGTLHQIVQVFAKELPALTTFDLRQTEYYARQTKTVWCRQGDTAQRFINRTNCIAFLYFIPSLFCFCFCGHTFLILEAECVFWWKKKRDKANGFQFYCFII